jgi:hypothetical protein
MSNERPYAEEAIWWPIAADPASLGFPGAAAIHQVQVGDQGGYVDLVLLPQSAPAIVLIEAKRAGDARSAADVVGQLLKYYTHALAMGMEGVTEMRKMALMCQSGHRPSRLMSLRALFQAKSQEEAGNRACAGRILRPPDVGLVIALDSDARKFERRLFSSVAALDQHHGLSIGIAMLADGKPRWHRPWTPNRSLEQTGSGSTPA